MPNQPENQTPTPSSSPAVEGRKPTGAAGPKRSVIEDDVLIGTLRPLDAKLFGYHQARHLLWRAGFGGSEEQVRTLLAWGPAKSVDYLINASDVPFEEARPDAFDKDILHPPGKEERDMYRAAQRAGDEDTLARVRLERQKREQTDRTQMGEVQKWWLKRMIETPRPLEEKLTLFWHGHFATSFRGVEDSYHMYQQNQLFRSHALGNFGDLLFAIVRDPAMIKFLNNNDSRKNKPNENLARELMELFSLGVGNYTEKDIKEGARALTGYTFDDDAFVFQQQNHDNGGKDILGKHANMDGDAFVRTILEQRACSAHIARKLYEFFVGDLPADAGDIPAPQKSALRELGNTMLQARYELKPVLRRLFLSEHFYDQRFFNEQIKSPVQLVVGAVRSLNTPVRDLSVLNDALDLMGQRIFMPPSVKGWNGGRSWINTSTMFVRQNIMTFLITGRKPKGSDKSTSNGFDALAILPKDVTGPREVVDALLGVTLGQKPQPARRALLAYLESRGNTIDNDTLTSLVLLITAMPEYQLC